MRIRPGSGSGRFAAATFVAFAVAWVGCGTGGDGDYVEPDIHHPLAAALVSVQRHFSGLDETDGEALQSFIRYADPDAPSFEVRRVCAQAGRALAEADPAVVGGFVTAAADHLYDDFFRLSSAERRNEIAANLGESEKHGEIHRLRMEAILRRGGGVYEGTLGHALSVVPFEETMAILPLDPDVVLAPDATTPAAFAAAGEILGRAPFFAGVLDRERARATFLKGLEVWPGDPLLVAGLVSFYIEAADEYGVELDEFLPKAESLDPENAAWPCLRAARALRRGRDTEALAALRIAAGRSMLSFHGVERGRAVDARLQELGYGPIRSRLAAYRTEPVGVWLELKDLANRSIQRSFEYEAAEKEDDLVQQRVALARALAAAPRVLFAELLRSRILVNGYQRLAEQSRTLNPTASHGFQEKATREETRLNLIERTYEEFGGPTAWARYLDLLGEERFLSYFDGVVFGNEAEYLLQCAGADSFQAVLRIAERPFPFE